MGRVTSYGTKGTENAATFVHRRYAADGQHRGVIFCHGLNGYGWHPVNYPNTVIDEMVRRGHPVISPDLGGPATWGNDAAQAKIADARTYLQGTLGAKSGGVLLWAGSMGTLAALNFARNNPSLVAGVACGLPAVSLSDLHDNAAARGVSAVNIEAAYGGNAGYVAGLAAHDPAANAAAYASQAAKIKLWYSSDDTTVPASVVTDFAAASGIAAQSTGASGHVFNVAYTNAVCDFLQSL